MFHDLFYRQGKKPGTHATGSRVGPRGGLDAAQMRKMYCPCWKWNHSSLIVYPVVSLQQGLQYPGPSKYMSMDFLTLRTQGNLEIPFISNVSHIMENVQRNVATVKE